MTTYCTLLAVETGLFIKHKSCRIMPLSVRASLSIRLFSELSRPNRIVKRRGVTRFTTNHRPRAILYVSSHQFIPFESYCSKKIIYGSQLVHLACIVLLFSPGLPSDEIAWC